MKKAIDITKDQGLLYAHCSLLGLKVESQDLLHLSP